MTPPAPSFKQAIDESIQWKLNYIDQIIKGLKLERQKLVINAFASLLLFILVLRYNFLWIPFCISVAYFIIPLATYRWHKNNLAFWKKELEEMEEYSGKIQAVS